MRVIRERIFLIFTACFLTSCMTGNPGLEKARVSGLTGAEEISAPRTLTSRPPTNELLQFSRQSLQWRTRIIQTYQNFQEYQKAHKGRMSAQHRLEINWLIEEYVYQIRNPLVDLTRSQLFFMELDKAIFLHTDGRTFIERREGTTGKEFKEMARTLDSADAAFDESGGIFHINPHDREGQNLLMHFRVSFAAALILLDNYALGLDPLMNDTGLRRSLFFDIPGLDEATREALQNFRRTFYGYRNSEKLVTAFHIYQKIRRIEEGDATDAGYFQIVEELDNLIETSLAYRELVRNPKKENIFDEVVQSVDHLFQSNGDRLSLISHHATHFMGRAFGHSASLFQSRDGKLKNMAEPEYHNLKQQLKPLDILIEKSQSRLTDKLIPGHYGHLAVWVGTEKELRALGVWDRLPGLYRKAVERYSYNGPSFQQAIREGKHVVEALRQGVHFHSLRHFLDIDDLAVLRPRLCGDESKKGEECIPQQDQRRYLINVFRQIGKNYDFNFDVNSKGELICSEVAYHSFSDIEFQTDKTLGTHVLSPDQVGRKADEATDPFYPALIYFNGTRIPGDSRTLSRLLGWILDRNYPEVKRWTGIETNYY